MRNPAVFRRFIAISLMMSANVSLASESQEWSEIYRSEMAQQRTHLGLRCVYSSAEQAQQAIEDFGDKQLLMSVQQFHSELAKNGLTPNPSSQFTSQFGTQDLCYMSENEYVALAMYTGNYYQQINAALRSMKIQELKKYRVLIKFILSALSKLKNFEGYVKRGTSLKPEAIGNCQEGALFADRGFLSTSTAGGFGGSFRFLVKPKTCKYIAPLSNYPNEEEVLCLPGTVFQIRYLAKKQENYELIVQEVSQQLDIDDLISVVEKNPSLQNPDSHDFYGNSCQPINRVDLSKNVNVNPASGF